jgi:tetraacyldisaccharide 4'-kinase
VIRHPGFWSGRPSWPLRLALLPLDVASWLYGAGAALHRALWEFGVRRRARLACRVVSVGNLVVGGAGKTPAAAWIASAMHRRGHRTALASRGYARRGREPVEVVSDGRFLRSRAEVAGDEPMWLASRAPGVPVLVGRHRDVVGLRAVAAFGTQVLVLDDGFQHHRLARDVEIVLFDGAFGLGNRRVLPRGPLREPPRALSRADAIGVVDGPLPPRDEDLVARLAPAAHRFALRRRPLWVQSLDGSGRAPLASLAGRGVGILCGIARPASFRATVEALGAHVVAERSLPDHHRFRPRDLEGLAERCPLWLVTEKDALKILPAWARGADVRVLGLDVEVEDPETFLDWLEDRLRAKPRGRDAALPHRARIA